MDKEQSLLTFPCDFQIKIIGNNTDSFEMEIFSNIRSAFDHDIAPILLIDFGASKTIKISSFIYI